MITLPVNVSVNPPAIEPDVGDILVTDGIKVKVDGDVVEKNASPLK